MAKKAKKISAEMSSTSPEYKPCLYLDLPSRGMLDDLELGETVELVIRGKVKGMSSSSRKYPEGTEAHHTLDIEDYSVKMSESGKFEAMADDMDEDN